MQITQTKNEALKREFIVTLSADEIGQKIDEKLTEIGKTANMPGFRPGKIPLTLLKSKYGKSVMGEVLEKTVNDSTLKAINENELRPAMRPKIEVKTFDEKEGLEYTMAIELLPEIKVMEFSGLELEKMTAKPDEKTVREALERINRTPKKVEEKRAAKKGDTVVVDFDGTVDGKPFPGMKGSDFALELGSKSFIDTFEDQLVGTMVGDHKTVKVTFPEDYGQKELKGVDAVFEVEVKELRESIMPTLDDASAKTMGFDSLAKVEEAVEKQIQNDYDRITRMNIKRSLLDALDKEHTFEVPGGMVEAELQGILQQIKAQQPPTASLEDSGHVCSSGCEHNQATEEEKKEFGPIAERRVKLGLVLAEVGRVNKIEVVNQELQQAVINEARRYPGKEREVFEYYQKNPESLEGLKAPIYEDKVVDFILEKATIDTRQVAIEELMKSAEQEAPGEEKSSVDG